MDSSTLKQLTLTEMLSFFKSEKLIKDTKTNSQASKIANSTPLVNRKTVGKQKKRCINKRIIQMDTKIANNQRKITDMLKCKSVIADPVHIQNKEDSGYSALTQTLQKSTTLGKLRKTAEEYEMCISLSDTDEENLLRNPETPSLHKAPIKATVAPSLLVCHPANDQTIAPPGETSCVSARMPTESINLISDKSNLSIKAPLQAAKPAPIFIAEDDFNAVKSLIENTIGTSYVMRSTKQGFRVLCDDINSQNKLRQHLDKNQSSIKSHTYQPKHERGFRAVIRHLHRSTPISWVRDQLTKLGYNICFLDVIKNSNGNPLKLIELELRSNDSNVIQSLLQLNKLGNHQIQVEKLKRPRLPQCFRCQQYGHTKNYCCRPYVCVKCAGNHHPSDCTKAREAHAKCANCNGNHTANYHGCKAYKLAAKSIFQSRKIFTKRPPLTASFPRSDSLHIRTYNVGKESSTTMMIPQRQTQDNTLQPHSYAVINSNFSQRQKDAKTNSNLKSALTERSSNNLQQTHRQQQETYKRQQISQGNARRTQTNSSCNPVSTYNSTLNVKYSPEVPRTYNNRLSSKQVTIGKPLRKPFENGSSIENIMEKLVAALNKSQENLLHELRNCSASSIQGFDSLSKSIQSLALMMSMLLRSLTSTSEPETEQQT